METIQLKDGKYVAVEKDKAVVFDKKVCEKEIADIDTDLASIPEKPSDETLLLWAKENYPMMNYDAKKDSLSNRKAYLQELVGGAK